MVPCCTHNNLQDSEAWRNEGFLKYFHGILQRRPCCRVSLGLVAFELAMLPGHDAFELAMLPQRWARLLVV